jgi:hypothetical protein
MKYRRAMIAKETLDRVQRRWSRLFEYAEPKGLRHRRVDAVEDSVCACRFNPLGAAAGKESMARFRKLSRRVSFGAFQAP